MNDTAVAERIVALGLGFRAARALMSAVELGVFDALSTGSMTIGQLRSETGLHPRGAADFLGSLVGLGLLECTDGRYANAPGAAACLSKDGATSLASWLQYLGSAQYPAWNALTASLRSGEPAGDSPAGRGFGVLHEDAAASQRFTQAMAAGIAWPARLLAEQFPWARYSSFVDVGAAGGHMAATVAGRHPHLRGIGFDLPPLISMFDQTMRARGVADRVRFQPGNFFVDSLPEADVVILARILHDWDVPTRRGIIEKAHAAVPEGGAVIVCEALIDDSRCINADAMLASLHMLMQTAGGSESTVAECAGWMQNAGFSQTHSMPLLTPFTALVAIK